MPKVSHPRFVIFLVLLFGTSALLWRPMGAAHAISLGFDIAAVLFIAWIARVMSRSDADDIRRHADENDAGRAALLMIAIALTLVVLVTVATELKPRGMSILEIALPVVTIVIAWFFGNTVYTLHYAHLFYDQVGADESAAGEKGDRGGLDFPECETPDYWDFAYFAFNNGMAFQVSDVRVTTRAMRRAVLAHCMIAFFFNIGVLALTLNILSSAIGGG